MSSNVVSVVALNNERVVIWFDSGTSRVYTPADLQMENPSHLHSISVRADGSGITWPKQGGMDADQLVELGEEVDYVTSEKQRILKGLASIRREGRYSQTRLGEAAGIRQSVISRIEGCEISPQINTLLKLLAPLGKTLDIVDLKDKY